MKSDFYYGDKSSTLVSGIFVPVEFFQRIDWIGVVCQPTAHHKFKNAGWCRGGRNQAHGYRNMRSYNSRLVEISYKFCKLWTARNPVRETKTINFWSKGRRKVKFCGWEVVEDFRAKCYQGKWNWVSRCFPEKQFPLLWTTKTAMNETKPRLFNRVVTHKFGASKRDPHRSKNCFPKMIFGIVTKKNFPFLPFQSIRILTRRKKPALFQSNGPSNLNVR